MSDNFVKIRIGSELDAKGFEEAEKHFGTLSSEAREFIDTLKLGIGIDLGGKLVGGIETMIDAFREGIAEGVRFNAELESMQLSLAGMLRQFGGGAVGSFNQGLGVSGQLISEMREQANKLGVSFEAMLETYKTTAGAMFQGGVTDLNRQVELSGLLMRTMQGLGISGFMATRDTQDLLTGMADRTKAGRELGIRDEDIQKAKEQGQLYEFLTQKLSGFAEAGTAGAHTFNAEMERLHNTTQQLQAELAKPLFDELKDSFAVLSAELQKPEVREEMHNLGLEIGEVAKDGLKLLEWVARHIPLFQAMATSTILFGVALAGLKIAQITGEIGAWSGSVIAGKKALDEETMSITRNTAAMVENAAAAKADASAKTSGAATPNLNFGPFEDRQAWLNAQRQVRPGGTTYAKYGADELGGIRTGAIGNAERMGLAGAESASGGMFSGALGGIGRTAAGLGEGMVYLTLIEKIGELITALVELRNANVEQVKQGRVDTKSTNDAVFAKLMQVAGDALPQDREHVEQLVGNERTRIQGLIKGTSDGDSRKQLYEDLNRLEKVITEFDMKAEDNYKSAPVEHIGSTEEDREVQRQEAQQQQTRMNESAERAFEKLGVAADDEKTKLEWLQTVAQQAREDFAAKAYTSANIDPMTASPEDMIEASKKSVTEKDQTAAIEAAERLAAALKEISKIEDANNKAIDDECTKEEEHRQKVEQTMESLAQQRTILQANLKGQYDIAAAAERHQKIEAEIARLVKEGVPEGDARKGVQGNADLQQQASRQQALKSLQQEHAIEQARVTGNKQLVEQLQQQKELEEEIQRLEQSGLSATEATAAAQQKINDLKAEEERAEKRKREEIDADDAAKSAEARHSRNAKQLQEQAEDLKRRHSLEDEFGTQEGDEIAEREQSGRRKGGTIGGPTAAGPGDHPVSTPDPRQGDHDLDPTYGGAKRSARDTLGDRMSDDAWHNQFSATGGIRNHDLDPDGGMGKQMSDDDWHKQFAPIGPKVPESPFQVQPDKSDQSPFGGGGAGQGGAGQGGNGGASQLGGAADAVQKGGTDLSSVAQKLQEGAQQMQQGIQQLTQVGTQIGTLGTAITTAIQNINTQIQTIQAEIEDASND